MEMIAYRMSLFRCIPKAKEHNYLNWGASGKREEKKERKYTIKLVSKSVFFSQ